MTGKENIDKILLCPLCLKDIPLLSLNVQDEEVVLHFRCMTLQIDKEFTLNNYMTQLNYLNDELIDHCIGSFKLVANDAINHKAKGVQLELICNEHEMEYEAFCIQCYRSICKKCKINSHDNNTNHHLIPIKSTLMIQMSNIANQIKSFIANSEESRNIFELLSSKEVKSNPKLIEQIWKLISANGKMNRKLLFIWTLISNTAMLIEERPNYALKKLISELEINQSKPIVSSLRELKNYLQQNYVLDLKETQMKHYDEITSYSCIAHNRRIRCIIQLSNSNLCTASEDTTIKIWELTTLKCNKTLEGHTESVTCLLQLKDNRLVSGGFDHSIKFWDLDSGKCTATIQGAKGSIWCLKQLSNEDLVFGSYYSSIQIWSITPIECKANLTCSNSVWELNQFTDGQLYACVENKVIEIWNPFIAQRLTKIEEHKERIMTIIELIGKKQYATCSIDKTITIRSLLTYRCIETISAHSDGIYSLVQLNSSVLASCSWDKSIKLWNITASPPQCITTLNQNEGVTGIIKLFGGRLTSIANTLLTIWNN